MKMLVFVFAMFVSSVYAAEIKVLDIPGWYETTATAEFNINRELGRAWVEGYVKDSFHNDDRPHNRGDFYRQLVPGLSFDSSRNVIVLDTEGQQVECATVVQRGRSIFRHNKITNTNCTFVTKRVMVDFDNGYEVQKRPHLEVYLVTK